MGVITPAPKPEKKSLAPAADNYRVLKSTCAEYGA